MARSTFGATNDTNEIFPRKSRHAVDIREIRCRLRLREIYLYQHGYKKFVQFVSFVVRKDCLEHPKLELS